MASVTHEDLPTTLFRSVRRSDGRHVCIDADHLAHTTKIVRDMADYHLAKSLGWHDHPTEAHAALEAEEEQISTDAGVRNFDDRHLSDKAKLEAEEAERHTIRHIADIPVAPKRGRPKKIVTE